jgi:hypothetical protein
MALLGVLARVEARACGETVGALEKIDGVTPFPLEEDERIGILIEGATLDEAHAILTAKVSRVPGILAAWPVFADFEPEVSRPAACQSEPHDGP